MAQSRATRAPSRSARRLLAVLVLAGSGLVGAAATACPDWQLMGQPLSYSADQLWTPQTHSVIAGGQNNLHQCPQPGVGHVATRPDFDLSFLQYGMARDLEFRVNASCDSVLLVNDAQGRWHFNDDNDGGLNARLRISNAPEGAYDIWVGTYGPSTCPATLTLETFGGIQGGPVPPTQQPGMVLGCPDPSMSGQTMTYRAADLARPQLLGLTAGGAMQISGCPLGFGQGYVDARPQLSLDILDAAPGAALDLRVDGTCDTVMLVNDPLGRWSFNDDADGSLNPHLTLDGMMPGRYGIWVGTYSPTPCSAALTVSVSGAAPVAPPQPQSGFFPEAWYNGEPVDGCLYYGQNCGQEAADRFCQMMGHIHAADGAFDFNTVSRTLVLGDNRICTIPNGCGHLINVTCVPSPEALGGAPGQPAAPVGVAGAGDTVFRFANGIEGWSANSGTLSTVNGSHMHVVTPGDGRTGYLVAPASVAGDWRGVRAVEVNIRARQGRYFGAFEEDAIGDIVLYNGSMTAAAEFPQPVGTDWARMTVSVEDTRLWRLGGGASSVADVLRNVTAMRVRGEFMIGDTWADVNEIAIRGAIRPADAAQPAPGPGAQQAETALPASGNLQGFRDRVGQTLRLRVTGAAEGRVWGAGIYTDDSSVARAAVHAGVLQVGQTGVVEVMILPGQSAYEASTLNGVETTGYGDWGGSYRFVVSLAGPAAPAATGRFELVVVPEGIIFDAARRRAENMGGHLATVTSADELQQVFAVANNPAAWSLELGRYFVGPWLGGYRQGNQWMWITGEPWGFTAWAPGQPDDAGGRETHLNMWVRGTSPAPLLNDADPNVPLRGFVVEYPAPGQAAPAAPLAPQPQGK